MFEIKEAAERANKDLLEKYRTWEADQNPDTFKDLLLGMVNSIQRLNNTVAILAETINFLNSKSETQKEKLKIEDR